MPDYRKNYGKIYDKKVNDFGGINKLLKFVGVVKNFSIYLVKILT